MRSARKSHYLTLTHTSRDEVGRQLEASRAAQARVAQLEAEVEKVQTDAADKVSHYKHHYSEARALLFETLNKAFQAKCELEEKLASALKEVETIRAERDSAREEEEKARTRATSFENIS